MRLQSAVDAVGDDNSSEAKMLRDVLKKAQQEATSAPNLSREPGTGCPKPTKRCGKLKTSEPTLEGWRTAIGGASSGGF